MATPRYRSLYQINTRVWLTDLSRRLGRAAMLDDVPDAELEPHSGFHEPITSGTGSSRKRSPIFARKLYLDLPGRGFHVF